MSGTRRPLGGFTGPALRVVELLGFAFVVHVFVIPQLGGARRALSVLGSVNGAMVAAVLVLEAASWIAYARLTQLLLPVDERPSLPIMVGTTIASTGVNHVVPGGAAATAAVNYRLLGRAGVGSSSLGFALGLQALGSAVVLNVILWVALVVSIPATGFQPLYGLAAAVGATVIATFSLAVVGMLRGRDTVANRIAKILGALPRVDEGRVRVAIERLADQLATLAGDRERLRMVIALAAANWMLDAAALWVAIAAFGTRPAIAGLLVAYGLANVTAAVPVSPGGLGIVEAVLIPTLVAFGTPRAEAAIAVVAYRLANFWLPIPLGAISYAAVQRMTHALQVEAFRDEINRQLGPRQNPDPGSA